MNAKAVHLRDDDLHAVALGAIRVLVCRQGHEWFAQGVEIDYAASGTSIKDVQDRFERGLAATVHRHLEQFSGIDRLLRFAPREAWEKLSPEKDFHFDMVTAHDLANLDPNLRALPFGQIVYLEDGCQYEAASQG